MGIIVLVGLLVFKPLAYFAAVMMIFAGLTGICLLEKFFAMLLGTSATCGDQKDSFRRRDCCLLHHCS